MSVDETPAAGRSARRRLASRGFEFEETMGGICSFTVGPLAGRSAPVAFEVRARAASLRGFFSRASGAGNYHTWRLDGRIAIGGLAVGLPAIGTLEIHPLRGRGMLVYDLDFLGPDGRPCHLHGEKHRSWLRPWRGMTTLYTTIGCDGGEVGTGVLRFELGTLGPFLRSWRLV